MPKVTIETVEQVSRLARLSLTAEEKRRFARQLDQVLSYAQSIQDLDVSSLPPTSHAATCEVFREDQEAPGLDRRKVLDAAPDALDALFRVPKVLG